MYHAKNCYVKIDNIEISTYYNSCLDWYSMYAIRYKELVKKDEGINNNMAKKRDKKNKLRGKWLRGIIIVYLLLILCNLFHEFPSRLGNLHSIPVSEEWYLIVVNRWNEIPEDYRVELTELSNGQKVDSRIYPYLQEMFDAARKDGIYPVVREGYRTYEEQQKILDDKIKAYINEGYSQSRAERTAKEWVALPGTSEHQLGNGKVEILGKSTTWICPWNFGNIYPMFKADDTDVFHAILIRVKIKIFYQENKVLTKFCGVG